MVVLHGGLVLLVVAFAVVVCVGVVLCLVVFCGVACRFACIGCRLFGVFGCLGAWFLCILYVWSVVCLCFRLCLLLCRF